MWLRSGFFHSVCAQGSPAWWQVRYVTSRVRYVTSRVRFQRMHVACFVYSFLRKPMDVWRIPTCAMVNEAATDIHVQVFAWMCVSSSPGCTPKGVSAGAYGNSLFNHRRTTRRSSKEASPLYIPISHRGGLRLLHVLANTHYRTFLITVILVRCLTVVLTCISLMTDDTGYLFMHLLTICSNLFGKCF